MRRTPPFVILVTALLSALAVFVPMQVVLHAAITVTEKMTGGFGAGLGSTSNITSYTSSDTMTIANGTLLACIVTNTDGDGTVEEWDSVQYTGISSMTKADSVVVNNATRVGIWWGIGNGTSSTMNGSISDAQTGAGFSCYEVAGATISTPVLQTMPGTSSATTTHTVTLTSARTPGSVLFFTVASQSAVTWTAEYGSTGTEMTYASPTTVTNQEWDIGGADTTPSYTTAGNQTAALGAVEFALAGAAAPCNGRLLMMLGAGC